MMKMSMTNIHYVFYKYFFLWSQDLTSYPDLMFGHDTEEGFGLLGSVLVLVGMLLYITLS